MYIYIYIHIERERAIYVFIYIYIYVFVARIRRLRESPQYLLVILRGRGTVSANLRTSPQNFRKNYAEHTANPPTNIVDFRKFDSSVILI